MKGIILAGGSGTRLYPITRVVSKQLLPVYDKPMIYYPLSVLMLAGIREILIISTPADLPRFRELLGDGRSSGSAQLRRAAAPGRAGAGLCHRPRFIGTDSTCLILGDNIFFGHDLSRTAEDRGRADQGGLMFGYRVKDPERYGVVSFDATGRVLDIEEKPAQAQVALRGARPLFL
jgi:glucose-1-phosphate thymidylyltransferase